jgi:hypothetical protein
MRRRAGPEALACALAPGRRIAVTSFEPGRRGASAKVMVTSHASWHRGATSEREGGHRRLHVAEQAERRRAGPPSDVYSAMVLYELPADKTARGRRPAIHLNVLPVVCRRCAAIALTCPTAHRRGRRGAAAVARRATGAGRCRRRCAPSLDASAAGRARSLAGRPPGAPGLFGEFIGAPRAARPRRCSGCLPGRRRLLLPRYAAGMVCLPRPGCVALGACLPFNVGFSVGLAYLAFAIVFHVLTARRPVSCTALGPLLLPVSGVFGGAGGGGAGSRRGLAAVPARRLPHLLLRRRWRSLPAGFVAHSTARHLI